MSHELSRASQAEPDIWTECDEMMMAIKQNSYLVAVVITNLFQAFIQ